MEKTLWRVINPCYKLPILSGLHSVGKGKRRGNCHFLVLSLGSWILRVLVKTWERSFGLLCDWLQDDKRAFVFPWLQVTGYFLLLATLYSLLSTLSICYTYRMSNGDPYSTKSTVSWAFYDLANTLYSAAVVTVFLPLYITTLTQWNITLGMSATFAMILAGLFSPAIGAVADQTGKTKRYLVIATLITCLATFFMSFSANLIWVLICFVIAHFFFHLCLVYYNSLLVCVAPSEKQGWVSGLGVGLGYGGVLIALPIAYWVEKSFGTRFIFPTIALFYFLGALPLFAFVPERKVASPKPFHWNQVTLEIKEVYQTILSLVHYPKILFFLLSSFFVQEAINAVILWLAVFIKFTFGLDQGALILVLVFTNLSACLFGLGLGFLTDRIGAYKILWFSYLSLLAVLVILVIAPNAYVALASIILFGGAGFAGFWTAGRKFLISISPENKIGEFFGLYGMTTKLSCFSMALFALIADAFGFRMATIELILMVVIGMGFLILVGKLGEK